MNPKLSHYYMFPSLCATQTCATQTDVLGSRPWPRGLFTLSARLVDGAGAGRCRMPGAVSDQVLAGLRRGQGSESSQTQLAGFEGSGSSSTQPESPRLPSCSRASTPSTPMRLSDTYQVAQYEGSARGQPPVSRYESRKPTPLQTARWKAVQKAKRNGLSIRGIARELRIHRETVRKYMNAESPPMSSRSRARATSEVP